MDGINSQHTVHCDAARRITATYFDSGKVLSDLLANPFSADENTAHLPDLMYLASGKPCIVEDTGFGRLLQGHAKGLHSFKDLKGAIQCFERVLADYKEESCSARSIAEEFFDARKICRTMLSRVL